MALPTNRPIPVTVFGILNIVFAALGILGVLSSLALFAAVGIHSNNPVIQLMHNSPAYAAWMKVSVGLGLLVCPALLASGIGLLKLQSWARVFSIVYAIYAVVMVIVSTVANYFLMVQPLLVQAQGKPGPEAAGLIGAAIGGTIGSCAGVIYPILLLIFMLRPKVAAAFKPAGSA
jgi:hypothetical protein